MCLGHYFAGDCLDHRKQAAGYTDGNDNAEEVVGNSYVGTDA